MKLWMKILIGALTGFAGGFASGFLVHKKLNDVQFEEVSEEEMKQIEEKVKVAQEKAKETEKELPKDLPDDPDKLRMALQGKTPYIKADEEKKKAYEKLWSATKEYSTEENANDIPVAEDNEEDEEDEDERLEEEDYGKKDDFIEPPHEIGLADFYNDRPEYDKVTIHWYEPDDVWLDENEEIIPDIKSYIGTEVKNLFTSNSPDDDPDTRFVRNDKYGSDYEVIRHHRSYIETVGGVD